MDILITDLIKRIKRKTSFTAGLSIQDSSIQDFINDNIVYNISDRIPYRELGNITTVKDQLEYTIDDTDIIKINKIFYEKAYSGGSQTNYGTVFNGILFDGFCAEDMGDIAIDYINTIYSNYRSKDSSAKAFYNNGVIFLGEAPDSAFDVYYIANKRWSYATIPNALTKLVELYTIVDCLKVLRAHWLNNYAKGIDNYNSILRHLKIQIDDAREERDKELDMQSRIRLGML